ncbi:Zn-ribbon domain-containing OB-fold protein [Rhizobium leguminosarum]|uniref:Zn-ribbon domain-containing OB-fold protein n=1 Tax=Rhizobium leguminosarum TaxID=384 RepID=UPI003F993663
MDVVKEETTAVAPNTQGAVVNLNASRDIQTGKGVFPRVPSTSPSADRYQPIKLSREAELYSFTVIHPNPKTGLKPFALIYADFAEDTRVFGRLQLNEGEKPKIGMRLRVSSDDATGDIDSNYFFEPAGRAE